MFSTFYSLLIQLKIRPFCGPLAVCSTEPAILASPRKLAESEAREPSATMKVCGVIWMFENVVGLPRCWRRDIIVRVFCRGTAPLLKFVQIDSEFFLHWGVDPLLQAADQLVVEKLHSERELLLTSPDWRLGISHIDTVIDSPSQKQHLSLHPRRLLNHLPSHLTPLRLTSALKGAYGYDFLEHTRILYLS